MQQISSNSNYPVCVGNKIHSNVCQKKKMNKNEKKMKIYKSLLVSGNPVSLTYYMYWALVSLVWLKQL